MLLSLRLSEKMRLCLPVPLQPLNADKGTKWVIDNSEVQQAILSLCDRARYRLT